MGVPMSCAVVWASLGSLLKIVIVGRTGAALQGGDHAHSHSQLSPILWCWELLLFWRLHFSKGKDRKKPVWVSLNSDLFWGVGCISLLGRWSFLGLFCRVWMWEGKFLEWDDWTKSLVLRLEKDCRQYSCGVEGETCRLLCGDLTKHWKFPIRVGADCSRTNKGDK